MAAAAVFDFVAQPYRGLGKPAYIIGRLAQQVQHQAQGCLAPYAWQPGKLADSILKQLRRVSAGNGHGQSSNR
jgi:hypothetical protein